MLRILYKHYGGLSFFEGKSFYLLSKCLNNAVKKESELPKIINECLKYITEKKTNFIDNKINKSMRSSKEILSDYGLL